MSLATENIKDEKSCVAKTQDFLAFCIEKNTKCDYSVGFAKSGHIS